MSHWRNECIGERLEARDMLTALSLLGRPVREYQGEFEVRVMASAPSGLPISFKATASGATATENVDFVAETVDGFLAPGQKSTTVTFKVLDDAEEDWGETFRIAISEVRNATLEVGEANISIWSRDVGRRFVESIPPPVIDPPLYYHVHDVFTRNADEQAVFWNQHRQSNVVRDGDGHTIEVSYADQNVRIDPSTVDAEDIEVRTPFGEVLAVELESVPESRGDRVFARYRVDAPDGIWKPADDGTYVVRLKENQVADAHDNYFRSREIGSFSVSVDPALEVDFLADASRDGRVTLRDLELIRWFYGAELNRGPFGIIGRRAFSRGDVNGDGITDFSDYLMVNAQLMDQQVSG